MTMLMVRFPDPSLIKEDLLTLRIKILQLLSTLTSSVRLTCPTYQSSFPRLRVHLPVMVVCVLTTHIGLRCLQCVVIVLRLSPWSDNPYLLLSSFNPYLSDPLALLSLTYISHDVVFPFFFLSHNTIIVLLILRS